MCAKEATRTEKDSMGSMEVPIDAYFGASTMRAVLNFPISDLRFSRSFIKALGIVKQSAAKTNVDLGILDGYIGDAIVKAAQEIIDGVLDAEFVLDIFQTGSGTSTNTNANEVIANRATELLGGARGSRLVHPNDHVNMCQSSNDVIPTCIHLAALMLIKDELVPSVILLKESLDKKADEFWGIVKTGRTHLQDATPVRLGQEFYGYSGQMERALNRLEYACSELSEVALGGTAVGTGINAHPEFASRACEYASGILGAKVAETKNHFQAQSTLDNLVAVGGILRTIAVSLHKIANDIRWLGSGPRAGLGELMLPEVQPGSSIMPGKVNPVIPESAIQVVAQVLGNDATIVAAGMGGYFEINLMMPVAGYNILQAIALLNSSTRNLATQCVQGLEATQIGPEMLERGLMLGTALSPAVGYDSAAEIAKEAAKTGQTIREVAKQKTKLSDEEINVLLDPTKMTEPGLGGGPSGG